MNTIDNDEAAPKIAAPYSWPEISPEVLDRRLLLKDEARKMRAMACEIEDNIIKLLIQKASIQTLAEALEQAVALTEAFETLAEGAADTP